MVVLCCDVVYCTCYRSTHARLLTLSIHASILRLSRHMGRPLDTIQQAKATPSQNPAHLVPGPGTLIPTRALRIRVRVVSCPNSVASSK